MVQRIVASVVLVCSTLFFAGCATYIPPVSLLYSPSVAARGGSGDLFLKTNAQTVISGKDNLRWVIGKRKDSDGSVTGELLSVSPAEDMVLDALKRELTASGYRVESGSALPPGVLNGLDLTSIQIGLDETAGIPKIEATGLVKISFDVWKNGVKIKKLSYESRMSDFAIFGRDRLPKELIEKGLRSVMSQAVPQIVATLEQKSTK